MQYKRLIAALSAIALAAAMASCDNENAAKSQSNVNADTIDTTSQTTAFPDGLRAECSSDNTYMSSVTVESRAGNLYVDVAGGRPEASEYYAYYLMITADENNSVQVGFKNISLVNETSKFVFDFGTSQQYDYGEWLDIDSDDKAFSENVSTEHIPYSEDEAAQITATLSIDGSDAAQCSTIFSEE